MRRTRDQTTGAAGAKRFVGYGGLQMRVLYRRSRHFPVHAIAIRSKNLLPSPAADRHFGRVVALPKKIIRHVDFPRRRSTYSQSESSAGPRGLGALLRNLNQKEKLRCELLS